VALSTCGGKLIWTPEEDAVLIAEWNKSMGSSGKAVDGTLHRLHEIFPHRSLHALRTRKNRLVAAGKVPRLRLRNKYMPLSLSCVEAAWLCAIFEGEGSISDFVYADKRYPNRKARRTVRLAICYNSDSGMLRRVRSLVPHCYTHVTNKVGTDNRGVHTNLAVSGLFLGSYVAIADFLHNVLPYMAHEAKRAKSIRALEYLEASLA
jgi:hypothetical protein